MGKDIRGKPTSIWNRWDSPNRAYARGGNQETKILVEPLAYDEQNGYLREDGIVGTITTDGSSPKHNNRVVEPLVYDGFNQSIRVDNSTIGTITRNVGADLKRNGQGIVEPVSTRGSEIASTLRASMHKQGERNLVENLKNGRGYEGVLEPTIWGSTQEHCAVKKDVICPTLTQAMGAGGGQIPMTEVPSNYAEFLKKEKELLKKEIEEKEKKFGFPQGSYRVRKLTEKECFRLQGVKEDDFAKIRKNQSKSSCYHLAGDSITTSVLMALFGEMLDMDWKSKVISLSEELTEE